MATTEQSHDLKSPSRTGISVVTTQNPTFAPSTNDHHNDDKTTTTTTLIPTTPPPSNNGLSTTTDPHDNDTASIFAQSVVSGYTPSFVSTSQRPLLPTSIPDHRRRSAPSELRKTPGRRAYVGACKALDIVVPIDYDERKTSMSDSSIVKLARSLKRL